MTPAVFSLGVATLAIVLKIVFAWAIHEDERLRRREQRAAKPKKPDQSK